VSTPAPRYEDLIGLWEDGARRLRALAPPERTIVERVVEVVVDGLRRRLGGPFTTAELAAFYLQGTDWAFDLAVRAAPGTPEAWDMTTVAGAAFSRYAREAGDFSTGRRVGAEPPPGQDERPGRGVPRR
jgi:hypothetical protein